MPESGKSGDGQGVARITTANMQRAEHGGYCLQEAGAVQRDAAKQYLLLADREGKELQLPTIWPGHLPRWKSGP